MAEFSLIERYCQDIGTSHSLTQIGVGDDAAVVRIPRSKELVVSVDTMVEAVHFFENTDPKLIAHKLVAVNLSDMAAMGAQPKWATLALTIPAIDEKWLSAFSNSLNNIAKAYELQLIGGDTTQGPLTLSMQIMGLVNQGTALTRSKSSAGDDVYVSGSIGDAGLALAALEGRVELADAVLDELRRSLDTPTPQVALGRSLSGLASACIDVSDGLLADLGHIATSSKVDIQLDVDRIPLSKRFLEIYPGSHGLDLALTGGDDYQLAFTAKTIHRDRLSQIANKLDVRISRIGRVIKAQEPNEAKLDLLYHGEPYALKRNTGFQHFS
ncbi:MAG: thiamine-monophosphate kinase [Arenicella sp.]